MSGKNCIITFPSTYYALKAEGSLKRSGFKVRLIPVPRDISSDCGLALEFDCSVNKGIGGIFKRQGIKIENLYYNLVPG